MRYVGKANENFYLDVKFGPLLVGLDDVAPVEIVIVVDHATAEVRLEIK